MASKRYHAWEFIVLLSPVEQKMLDIDSGDFRLVKQHLGELKYIGWRIRCEDGSLSGIVRFKTRKMKTGVQALLGINVTTRPIKREDYASEWADFHSYNLWREPPSFERGGFHTKRKFPPSWPEEWKKRARGMNKDKHGYLPWYKRKDKK